MAAASLVLSSFALAVSAWLGFLRWLEYGEKRKARIAVDPGEIKANGDSWSVELWLTNVGRSHARRVRVWLQDEAGNTVSEELRLERPLLSGGESKAVRLKVSRQGRSNLVVRPARRWRDSRDVSLPPDVSDQRITLR